MFGILFSIAFWIIVVAAGPKGNAMSLALAMSAMAVSLGMLLSDRSAV